MADLESGGHDADATKISETHSPAPDSVDPYDVDPDDAAYAAGNNPELAHGYQGRPDSPNSWNAYFNRPRAPGDAPSHAQPANDRPDAPEPGRTTESLDLWGDVEPDAARYADLDRIANPGGSVSPHNDDPAPDRATDANPTHPDQTGHAESDPERVSALEQRVSAVESENAVLKAENAESRHRIGVLETDGAEARQETADVRRELADVKASKEAENTDLRQQLADSRRVIADNKASSNAQIADLSQQLADREQQFADYRASNDAKYAGLMQQFAELKTESDERAARQERLEQLLADAGRLPGPESGEHRADQQATLAENQVLEKAAIAEREVTRQSADTRDVDQPVWRRMTSSENLALAQAASVAVETVRETVLHAPPDGRVTLGFAVASLAVLFKARAEKKGKQEK